MIAPLSLFLIVLPPALAVWRGMRVVWIMAAGVAGLALFGIVLWMTLAGVWPFARQEDVQDTYYVVAHFHYTMSMGAAFTIFAGCYYWVGKMSGRQYPEMLGKLHFWILFVGFHLTFLVQHWLGVEGMPRRYADYLPEDGFTFLNQVSTVGAFLLSLSMLPFFYNLYVSRKAPLVGVDDPWGWGRSLEWATSCPPPRHNFHTIPRIRSESPAFDLHHPEIAALDLDHNEAAANGDLADAPDMTGREDVVRGETSEGENS